MTATPQPRPLPQSRSLAVAIYGFGSVFGKTLRDSRRAAAGRRVLLGARSSSASAARSQPSSTRPSRGSRWTTSSTPCRRSSRAWPGRPVNVETLGGYLQYKYGTFFPLVAACGRSSRCPGRSPPSHAAAASSSSPPPRLAPARIALEKLSGHIVALVVAVLSSFVVASRSPANAFAVLPGDEIRVIGRLRLRDLAGLLASRAARWRSRSAPFVGRGAAAGIAGVVIRRLHPQRLPGRRSGARAAGQPDLVRLDVRPRPAGRRSTTGRRSCWSLRSSSWSCSCIGIGAFARRDIGATIGHADASLPRALVGLARAVRPRDRRRTCRRRSPGASASACSGLLLAASGRRLHRAARATRVEFMRALAQIFPGVDFAIGRRLPAAAVHRVRPRFSAGLAAATLVGGWASEETSGRLEMLFAAPLARGSLGARGRSACSSTWSCSSRSRRSALPSAPVGGRRYGTPDVGRDGARPVRGRDRHRRGRRRSVRHALGRAVWCCSSCADLVRPAARAGARPARIRAEPGPDRAFRPTNGRRVGLVRCRRLGRNRGRWRIVSAPGASGAATCAADRLGYPRADDRPSAARPTRRGRPRPRTNSHRPDLASRHARRSCRDGAR